MHQGGAPSLFPLIFAAALVVFYGGGCAAPVAWINPPVQVDTGIGQQIRGGNAVFLTDLEVAVEPLSLHEETFYLPVDPGLGFILQGDGFERIHAFYPHASLSGEVLSWEEGRDYPPGRIEVQGAAIFEDFPRATLAPMASVKAVVGAEDFTDGVSAAECDGGSNSLFCILFAAYGGAGAGLYTEARWMYLQNQNHWQWSTGITLEIPASAGIGFFAIE